MRFNEQFTCAYRAVLHSVAVRQTINDDLLFHKQNIHLRSIAKISKSSHQTNYITESIAAWHKLVTCEWIDAIKSILVTCHNHVQASLLPNVAQTVFRHFSYEFIKIWENERRTSRYRAYSVRLHELAYTLQSDWLPKTSPIISII